MGLVLDSAQQQIQQSASRFFGEASPISAFRRLRDSNDILGYSPEVWQQMRELGFAGTALPEAHGGLALGFVTLGAILEEAGRTLCPSPLFATSVLGAAAVEMTGSALQREELLGGIVQGETLALALEEGHRHDPHAITCTATRTTEGYRIDGEKRFVFDGGSATTLIVAAKDGINQQLAFFAVPRTRDGVTVMPLRMVDHRNAAHIRLASVSVPHSTRLERPATREVIDAILDRGRACLAAEMLGGIRELFDRTMEHLRQREQFGVKIGSFQALKHRAARMLIEVEVTQSAVIAALSALDDKADDAPLLCALAKAKANDTYRLVSDEATQMHGGMGVTDELDVGLFLKRSRVAITALGHSSYLRDRYATLSGY